MTQQVKELAAQHGRLSLNPRLHILEEENYSNKLFLTSIHVPWHACTHIQTEIN